MIAESRLIEVQVDVANPGEYFACCGLLEFANRLWPGAEASFGDGVFLLRATGDAAGLMKALRDAAIGNMMTATQKKRRDEIGRMGKKAVDADAHLQEEKKALDQLWRESPVIVGEPFGIRIDWFLDDRSGGKSFKTWAGQQSIIDIVTNLQRLMPPPESPHESWLERTSVTECVPLNFDSNLGATGADVDVGFSFDPLKSSGLRVAMRPAVELLAFAGLQRFRPAELPAAWEYGIWARPSGPELGALTTCGAASTLASKRFRFQLLYRTKYLKSFLPGRPV